MFVKWISSCLVCLSAFSQAQGWLRNGVNGLGSDQSYLVKRQDSQKSTSTRSLPLSTNPGSFSKIVTSLISGSNPKGSSTIQVTSSTLYTPGLGPSTRSQSLLTTFANVRSSPLGGTNPGVALPTLTGPSTISSPTATQPNASGENPGPNTQSPNTSGDISSLETTQPNTSGQRNTLTDTLGLAFTSQPPSAILRPTSTDLTPGLAGSNGPTTSLPPNTPSGVPFGVLVTTLSGRAYTLTYVGTTATKPTTIIESDASKTTTSSVSIGGAVWTIPTPPPGFPDPIPPGPPPGSPNPPSGGGSIGCLFGCGGGGGPTDGQGGSDTGPKPDHPSPTQDKSSHSAHGGHPDSTGGPDLNPEPEHPGPTQDDSSHSVSSTSSQALTSSPRSTATPTPSSITSQTSSQTPSTLSTSSVTSSSTNLCSPGNGKKFRRGASKASRGVGSFLGGLWKRSYKLFADTLRKRTVSPPPSNNADDGTWTQFYRNQQGQGITNGAGASRSSAFFESTAQSKTSITWKSGDLGGCTVLFVGSNQGAYFAHFWENLAFAENDRRENTANFQTNVLDFLNNGVSGDMGVSLQANLAAFKGNPTTQAHILTPNGGTSSRGYPLYSKINDLKNLVNQLVGVTPVVHLYIKPINQDVFDGIVRQAMIQIDPAQTTNQPRGLIRAFFAKEQAEDITFCTSGGSARLRARQDACPAQSSASSPLPDSTFASNSSPPPSTSSMSPITKISQDSSVPTSTFPISIVPGTSNNTSARAETTSTAATSTPTSEMSAPRETSSTPLTSTSVVESSTPTEAPSTSPASLPIVETLPPQAIPASREPDSVTMVKTVPDCVLAGKAGRICHTTRYRTQVVPATAVRA